MIIIFHLPQITYTENFIQTLWRNFRQPNAAPSIKHALISYLASFLARGKFIPISLVLLNILHRLFILPLFMLFFFTV